jgi:hypothetical protein
LPITTLGACGVGTENEIRARNVDHEAANLNSEVWMSRYSFCGVQLVSDLEFLESLASREVDRERVRESMIGGTYPGGDERNSLASLRCKERLGLSHTSTCDS